jgi:AraC-like DNA-binding protein
LNEKLDKSFNAYVNEYRIAEARNLIAREPQLKLESVAEQCGFNSNSTFFAVFKKIAGQTPASFRSGLSHPIADGPG